MPQFTIAALYHFFRFPDFASHQAPLQALCDGAGLKGTLLLAPEGVNGTIAGEQSGLDVLLDYLRALPGCENLEHKLSFSDDPPFLRMKVRLKREIVAMGLELDPDDAVGAYVAPEDWNALISEPETIVIDTRNDYEVDIGAFEGAVNPQTKSFREFPEWFRKFRETRPAAKIAMYCTGGIRCEKSTAFLKSEGVDEVYHLKGGILKYLETVPEPESLWRGECFVFDQRVSVGHGLVQGEYKLCYACRRPLAPEDLKSELFEKGVSCAACHHETDDAQKARFRERQRQVDLAQSRGVSHIGTNTQEPAE